MPRLNVCCFCLDMRQGTYLSAVYSIVFSVVCGAFKAVWLGYLLHPMDPREEVRMEDLPADPDDQHQYSYGVEHYDMMSLIMIIIIVFTLIMYAAWIVSAMLIIYGIKTGRRDFLVPWIIVTAIVKGLIAFYIITSLINFEALRVSKFRVMAVILNCIFLLVNLYALLCVVTFHRNRLQLESSSPVTRPVHYQPAHAPEATPMHWKEAEAHAV